MACHLYCLVLLLAAAHRTRAVSGFPSISDFFNEASADIERSFKLTSKCTVTISSEDNCAYKATSNPPNCMSPESVTKALFKSNPEIVGKITGALSSQIYMEELIVNICEEYLSMKNGVKGSLQVIKDKVRVEDVSVAVTVNIPTMSVEFAFSGVWTVGNLKLAVNISRTNDQFSIVGEPREMPRGFSITQLVNGMASTISRDIDISSSLNKLHLNNLVLKDVTLQAVFLDRGFAVRFSFTGVSSSLKHPRLHLTLLRMKGQTSWSYVATIGGEFRDVNIPSLFRTLTSVDVSRVPYIGKTTISKIKMLFSTNDVGQPLIPYRDAGLQSLTPIHTGIHLLMAIKFRSNSSPTDVRVIVSNKLVEFTVLGDSGVSVSKFLTELISKISIIPLPPKFSFQEFLDLRIKEFKYDSVRKEVTIPAKITRPVVFVPGAIEMLNTALLITVPTASTNGQRTPGIELKSNWQLGKAHIPFTVSKPPNMAVFIAESRPHVDIPFGEMIKQFAVSLLPGGTLKNAVRKAGLESFYISDPYLKMYFARETVMKVAGKTVVGVWDKCKAEIMIGKVGGAVVMATGLVIEQVPITKVIFNITNGHVNLGKLPGASILDNTDVSVVMSSQPVPRTQQYMQFSTQSLSSIEILDGVSLSGSFKFPRNCGNDQFCQVSKRLLGKNAQLVLKGRLALASVYLSATVPTEIQIFRGVNITDVGFEVETGLSRSGIGIKGALKLRDPPLSFIGAFGISTSGVYLSMSMAGMWKNPFRVPYLAIGNLHFRAAIAPTPTLINALAIGGQARLGKFEDRNAKPVEAEMYVGIDVVSPTENYFHAKFSPLTIRAFLEAFAYRPSLPKPLAEMGFPKGLYISYALKSKILPNGVSINRGFYLQGLTKVLFFEANCNIRLSLNGIFVNLTVTPFNIGRGLVSVSGRSSKMGPRTFVDIGWNPPRALINIEGSLQILGMRRTVNITVDHRGMLFHISGKFLNLFEAGLTVRSDYSSLKTADFQVSGYFRQNLFSRLEHEVRNSLDNYRKKADQDIANAQRKVENAKKVFDDAANKVRGLQRKVNAEKAKFDAAVRRLEGTKRTLESKKRVFDYVNRKLTSAQRTINSKKRAFDNAVQSLEAKKRSCPSNCRRRRAAEPFLQNDDAKGFLKRSKRGWGWRRINPVEKTREGVERGREWTRERGREVGEKTREGVENTKEFGKERARETACAARKAARAVCPRGVSALQWVVTQSKRSLDLAQRALDGLKVIVEQSKKSMDVAKGFVSAAQFTVNKSKGLVDAAVYALKAAETITRNAKYTLDVAKGALEAAKQTNRFGVMVGQRIASLGLGGLLNIEELKFDVRLSIAQSGHFRGLMRAKIMGHRKSFSFNIKLRSVKDMVMSLLEKVKDILGLRKKRSTEAHALTAIAEMKPSNANTHRILLQGNASCKFYEEISEIVSLVLNDTEDLTDTIKSLAETRSRVENSQVTTQDVDDLMRLGEEVLNTGLEAVMDLVTMETDMTEAELKQLLQEVGALGSDPCLKTIAHQLSQLLKPTTVELSVTSIDKLLKELQQTAGCLDTHRCQAGADENGPQ